MTHKIEPVTGFPIGRFKEAIKMVRMERYFQHGRWGDRPKQPDETWLAILIEEVGEAAQALLQLQYEGKGDLPRLRDEVNQCAAVSVAWLEALNARIDHEIDREMKKRRKAASHD